MSKSSSPLQNGLFQIVQRLPRHALTRAAARAADLRVAPALRAPLYKGFARAVGAELYEVEADLGSFGSFDAFFTRTLQAGARPWLAPPNGVGMPADGRLDAHGRTTRGMAVQAKGISYRLGQMIDDEALAARLDGGLFATVYLSPADYHRVHTPAAITIDRVVHLGGELWPVNGLSVPRVEGLFAVNERVVASFTTEDGRAGAMVMVGAIVVGRMSVAHPDVTIDDRHGQARAAFALSPGWKLEAGAEFGAFHLGSTVVMAIEDGEQTLSLAPGLAAGTPVRIGQPLWVPAS